MVMSTPNTYIVVSKYHFWLKESKVLGEMAGFRSRTENEQYPAKTESKGDRNNYSDFIRTQ